MQRQARGRLRYSRFGPLSERGHHGLQLLRAGPLARRRRHLVESLVNLEDAVYAPAALERERVDALAHGVSAGALHDLGELSADMDEACRVDDPLDAEVEVGVVAVGGEVTRVEPQIASAVQRHII